MEQETSTKNYEIGLYRHRESGQYIGAIDETQANAFRQWGYDLVAAGREAAMMSEEDIQAKYGAKKAPVEAEVVAQDTKKGK